MKYIKRGNMQHSNYRYIKLIKRPVKKALKSGYSKQDILQKLKEKHWPLDIINQTFTLVEKEKGNLNYLYWLGLIVASSAFIFNQYFFILLALGLIVMVISITPFIKRKKKLKKPELIIPQFYQRKHPQLKPIFHPEPLKKRRFWLFKKHIIKHKIIPKPQLVKEQPIQKAIHIKERKPFFSIFKKKELPKEIKIKQPEKTILKTPTQPAPEIKIRPKKVHNIIFLMILFLVLIISSFLYLYYIKVFSYLNLITYSSIIVIIFLIVITKVKKTKKLKEKKGTIKLGEKTGVEKLKEEVSKTTTKYETDFDKLYELLKKYKKLKVSDIAKIFNISKDEAEEWCVILERHDLGRLNYPAVGGSEILLPEEDEKNKTSQENIKAS